MQSSGYNSDSISLACEIQSLRHAENLTIEVNQYLHVTLFSQSSLIEAACIVENAANDSLSR